jgi:hypothetical protein
MTPSAPQRAAFKKYRRAYARTVVNAEALYIAYKHINFLYFARSKN